MNENPPPYDAEPLRAGSRVSNARSNSSLSEEKLVFVEAQVEVPVCPGRGFMGGPRAIDIVSALLIRGDASSSVYHSLNKTNRSASSCYNVDVVAIKPLDSITYNDLLRQLEDGVTQVINSQMWKDEGESGPLKQVRLKYIDISWDVEIGYATNTPSPGEKVGYALNTASLGEKICTRLGGQTDEKIRLFLKKMGPKDRFVMRYTYK